jgi:hypothetical protein
VSPPRLLAAGIGAADIETALAAWKDSSGLEGVRDRSGARIDLDGVGLEIQGSPGREGLLWLRLAVDDLEAEVERLQAQGIEVEQGPAGWLVPAASAFGVPLLLVAGQP